MMNMNRRRPKNQEEQQEQQEEEQQERTRQRQLHERVFRVVQVVLQHVAGGGGVVVGTPAGGVRRTSVVVGDARSSSCCCFSEEEKDDERQQQQQQQRLAYHHCQHDSADIVATSASDNATSTAKLGRRRARRIAEAADAERAAANNMILPSRTTISIRSIQSEIAQTRHYDIEIRTFTSFFHKYKQKKKKKKTKKQREWREWERHQDEEGTQNNSSATSDNDDDDDDDDYDSNTTTTKDGGDNENSGNKSTYTESESESECFVLTVISDMGIVREFHTPNQFATFVLPDLEDELREEESCCCSCQQQQVVHRVHSNNKSGFITAVSNDLYQHLLSLQLQQQQQPQQQQKQKRNRPPISNGKRAKNGPASSSSSSPSCSCPLCFDVFGTTKGLWWHLQTQHGYKHHEATKYAAHQIQQYYNALVVYKRPTNPSPPSSGTTEYGGTVTTRSRLNQNPNYGSREEQQQQDENRNIIVHNGENINTADPWSCVRDNGTISVAQLQAAMTATNGIDWSREQDAHGATLLHWAAGRRNTTSNNRQNQNLEIVRFLVEDIGCDIDQGQQRGKRGFAGRTPLHWACRNGNLDIVRYLLFSSSKSSSNTEKTKNGDDSDTDDATTIQKQRQDRLEATTADGTTAFCWAAWQGHEHILRYLHETWAVNIHSVNSYGCNAVLWSAQGPSTASSDDEDNNSERDSKNTDTAAATFNKNKKSKRVRLLEWLHDIGCDIYARNHSGHGVLHKAAQRGNQQVCEWFLGTVGRQAIREKCYCLNDDDDDSKPTTTTTTNIETNRHHPAATNRTSSRATNNNNNNNNGIDDDKDDDAHDHALLLVVDVVGPDNDGCTPSDLAGMEGHDDLAIYLAQSEEDMTLSTNWNHKRG